MNNKKDKRDYLPPYPRLYLSKYRTNKSISIETLAYEIGISPSYYFLLEGGYRGEKMTVILLSKLVNIFEITANEMVQDEVRYQENRYKFINDYKIKSIKNNKL